MATTVKKLGDLSLSKVFKIVRGWLNALPKYSAGTGISIGEDGKISATGTAAVDPTALPEATTTTKGAVIVGEGLTVDGTGKISVPAKSFKTINGESVEGTGNITIDLSLYKVVASLPTADIEDNKIYLVQSTETVPDGELNVYVEWIHVSGKWEKLGEFKTAVDLTPYATNEALNAAKSEAISTAEANAAAGAAELYMSKTELAATYQKQADIVEYTEAEVQAIADAAVAAMANG